MKYKKVLLREVMLRHLVNQLLKLKETFLGVLRANKKMQMPLKKRKNLKQIKKVAKTKRNFRQSNQSYCLKISTSRLKKENLSVLLAKLALGKRVCLMPL